MRVFVAGSTGAIGKFLVPHLVENGYEVVALVRTAQKAKALEAMGAKGRDGVGTRTLVDQRQRTSGQVVLTKLQAGAVGDQDPVIAPHPAADGADALIVVRDIAEQRP